MERKELKFEVLNDLGTISESTKGWSKKLTRIIQNEDEPKYDIRAWDSEFKKMGKGITLTEKELRSLKYLIDKELEFLDNENQNIFGGVMRRKNFILTVLIFLFINILSMAVESTNFIMPNTNMTGSSTNFQEALKDYKPNLENIDKIFNYIEKNIKQKGRAIFYSKIDQERKELIVTDENNKIIYTEKLPEKLVNSIPYFEAKQTYSLKDGKTLEYSEANFETLGKRFKIKNETLRKNRINKKDAIEALNFIGDINKASQTGFSKIEYSNMETFDENDNLILIVKYKNKKIIMEQEVEGNKLKMITSFDNLNTMNGKMETYINDTLASTMQIKNSISEGESKIFYPSGKVLGVTNIKNGTMDGPMKVFYEDGKIRMTGHFKNGKKDGEFIEYEEDGSIIDKILYKNDEIVSQ